MQGRIYGNEYRTTVVCIDSYENGVPVGRFYNPRCRNGKTFCSLTQFLIRMEDLLDEMKFPQSFTAARVFSKPLDGSRDSGTAAEDQAQKGKLGTFAVRVLFRQNASWQGSIVWLEGDREETFRSTLEMILLMDSALNSE